MYVCGVSEPEFWGGGGGGGNILNRGVVPNVGDSKGFIACENGFLIHISAISATNFQVHVQILTSEFSIVLYTQAFAVRHV